VSEQENAERERVQRKRAKLEAKPKLKQDIDPPFPEQSRLKVAQDFQTIQKQVKDDTAHLDQRLPSFLVQKEECLRKSANPVREIDRKVEQHEADRSRCDSKIAKVEELERREEALNLENAEFDQH
jgi:hypothetical protein